MKLIERIVKEYTQPLNEARAKKWTDDDKFWSKNITGKTANDNSKIEKYDITDIWGQGPEPYRKFQDTKAIDGDHKTFGDQNAKQHAFWKRRYDIEITGQHFDGLAKNGKGAVVPLLYNRLGTNQDTELKKFSSGETYLAYTRFKDSKHKVFISGTNQDIYDFFLSNDWAKDNDKPQKLFNKEFSNKEGIFIMGGFLARNSDSVATNLGRNGSDYSASIMGSLADAKDVSIWTDTNGIMTADPNQIQTAKTITRMSYDEAIELAYFGAKVIHPKTIQPLKKKGIPLYIKSFVNPNEEGSVIADSDKIIPNIPSYIVKNNQVLISISDTSLAFIVETHMSNIFSVLAKHGVGVNMMQNSAVSFSICVDNDKYKVPMLIEDLKAFFEVYYNDNLSL